MSETPNSPATPFDGPAKELAGAMEALSASLEHADLSPEDRRRVTEEMMKIYRQVSALGTRVAGQGVNGSAYEEESIGEQWPIIDQSASQLTNSPLTTAWLSNLLNTSGPGLVAGGTTDGAPHANAATNFGSEPGGLSR